MIKPLYFTLITCPLSLLDIRLIRFTSKLSSIIWRFAIKKILLIITLLLFTVIANAQDSGYRKVVAQQGDGIFKILRENDFSPADYFHEFVEINRNKIMENNQLIVGETYFLPLTETEKQTAYKIDSLARTLFSPTTEELQIAFSDSTVILQEEEIEITDSIIIDDIIEIADITSVHEVKELSDFAIKHGLLYADTVYDNSLEGAFIYIISGHGGPDPGAIAKVDGITISEDEYAYDISLRIARRVEEHGGKAIMIIQDPTHGIRDDRILPLDKSEICYPDLEIPLNHIERLRQRVDAVNKIYAANRHIEYHRVIEIHLDSRSTGTGVDVFFYHYPQSNTGLSFAEKLRETFDNKYSIHQPNRGYSGSVSGRNLYVIRRTHPPAVLIELGNIQNPRDQRRFLNHNNRQALANWITDGIIFDYQKN